jgi:hypothetical protein
MRGTPEAGIELLLSDGQWQKLEPSSLSYTEQNQGPILTCQITTANDGRIERARFLSNTHHEILALAGEVKAEDGVSHFQITLEGKTHTLFTLKQR